MQRSIAMTDPQPDASIELIVQAQSGDDDALNRLLDRYVPRLRRWASGRLPSSMRTMLDTGDLVQDAVVAALRRLPTIDVQHEGALFAYLRQAVNNRIIDLYRRKQRWPERQEMPVDAESHETSPLDAAMRAEDVERYEQALARLGDDDRQLIVLRVEFGFDYAAMAAAMNKPSAAAARMACTRAIGKLAQEMRRVG
jgi:RNA polymerase sigma-70 factor (ECF subfamily)